MESQCSESKSFADGGGEFVINDGSLDYRIWGTYTSGTGRVFTIYRQGAIPGWAINCNRCATISICSGYYSGNPLDLINKAKYGEPNGGKGYVLDSVGLGKREEGAYISPAQIENHLAKGEYLLLYLKGANYGHSGRGKSGAQWAGSMHWVAVLDYRQGENGTEIFVSSSANCGPMWTTIDEFEGMFIRVVSVYEK